jgi:hypothetical protein
VVRTTSLGGEGVSANRLEWQGLTEVRQALLHLPADLTSDATPIVDHATETAATSLRQAYPLGETGKLRQGVKVSVRASAAAVVGEVKSTSPHAHLWEFGTQNRHTRKGWFRGRETPHQGLVGIAVRVRRRMNEQLIALVKAAGFDVSGSL